MTIQHLFQFKTLPVRSVGPFARWSTVALSMALALSPVFSLSPAFAQQSYPNRFGRPMGAPQQYNQGPPPSQNTVPQGGDTGDETSPNQYYVIYTEQAKAAFQQNDFTKAIALLNKALQLAPTNPAVVNNLAAAYIRRGVYYQNQEKSPAKALSDYRHAEFILENAWPAGVTRTPVNEQNIAINRHNLELTAQALKEPANDWKWHLKSAWELRQSGNLQEAMVEYAWVTRIDPKNAEAWAAQGDIDTVEQRPDEAVQAYQKAADNSSSPSDTLWVKLGTAYYQMGKPEKSADALNKAIAKNPQNQDALLALEQLWTRELRINPNNMSAHLNLGAVFQQLGRYDQAEGEYRIAQRLAPNNPLILQNMASLYEAEGHPDRSLAMVNDALSRDPQNNSLLVMRADLLKRTGQNQAAEGTLEHALGQGSDKRKVYEELVSVNKAEGDPQKIKEGWSQYAGAFPEDATVQYRAGLAVHELNDYPDAAAYYQKAIHIKPDFADAYANLGTALHAMNQDAEALPALKKAISLDSSLDQVKPLIASIEQQQTAGTASKGSEAYAAGKYADAAREYEAAIKADPNNADLQSRLGLALQALQRYSEALKAYDKARTIDPKNATYAYYTGTLYDAQNDSAKAKEWYEKALALDPTLNDAKQALENTKSSGETAELNQALDAYNKKSYAKALQLTQQVIQADPQNATAYYYKGLVYDAEKKLPFAKLAYQKATELDPKLSDAFYALAVVYDNQGQKIEAKKTYQQFLTLTQGQKEDDFIKYAKQRISAL